LRGSVGKEGAGEKKGGCRGGAEVRGGVQG